MDTNQDDEQHAVVALRKRSREENSAAKKAPPKKKRKAVVAKGAQRTKKTVNKVVKETLKNKAAEATAMGAGEGFGEIRRL